MIFVTYGGRSSVLDNAFGVNLVRKDSVQFVDKVTVVDKTSVTNTVPVDELSCLLFSQANTEGAEASAELKPLKCHS